MLGVKLRRMRVVPFGLIRVNLGQEAMALAINSSPDELFPEPGLLADSSASISPFRPADRDVTGHDRHSIALGPRIIPVERDFEGFHQGSTPVAAVDMAPQSAGGRRLDRIGQLEAAGPGISIVAP